MKRYLGLLGLIAIGLILFPMPALALRFVNAPGKGTPISLDSSSANVTSSFGAVLTGLSGKSHLVFQNPTATSVELGDGVASDCSDATARVVVAGNSAVALDDISINSVLCIKSLGSTISSGVFTGGVY